MLGSRVDECGVDGALAVRISGSSLAVSSCARACNGFRDGSRGTGISPLSLFCGTILSAVFELKPLSSLAGEVQYLTLGSLDMRGGDETLARAALNTSVPGKCCGEIKYTLLVSILL